MSKVKLLSQRFGRPLIRRAAFFLLAVAVAGCHRDDVKVYSAAKDDHSPTPENNQLQFILPGGWTQIAPSQMRVASFTVTNTSGPSADVGVIPLPAGENELALVNMWRDQMQLPELTNGIAAKTVSVGDAPAKFYEIASDAPLIDNQFRARILVAELDRGNTSWFFKMTGENGFVAAQKTNFLQFLKSVSFVENSAMPMTGAPAVENQNAQSANPNPGLNSIWTIPSDWKSVAPSQFLLAEFLIQTNGATAEVNVAELAGEGGGLAANVNRWRGQLGLPPITEILASPLSPADASGAKVVDFTGTDAKTGKPARLVGAIIPKGGQTWFYKLMGDPQIVAAQRDAFIQFIQSAKD